MVFYRVCCVWGGCFIVGSVVKNLSANAGDIRDLGSIPGLGRSPGGGDGNPLQYSFPLEEEMAIHSTILSWRIPQTEESGELQSMGSRRVGHDERDFTRTHMCVLNCKSKSQTVFIAFFYSPPIQLKVMVETNGFKLIFNWSWISWHKPGIKDTCGPRLLFGVVLPTYLSAEEISSPESPLSCCQFSFLCWALGTRDWPDCHISTEKEWSPPLGQ